MLVHATRKSISEAGDKLTDEEKDSVEAATLKLEEAIKLDNLDSIEDAT
jgi:molecular chaperone DnaK